MDFEKICMMFTMQEPFYGILLSSMERVPTNRISTLAVYRSGNVFGLAYNPDFVNKLSIGCALEAIKHEVLHVAFNHFTIWDTDNPPKDIQSLRNIAADMEVNSYIDRAKVDSDQKWVFASDEGWENCLGTREYFNRLLQKAKQQQQQKQQQMANQPQKPCNGGGGGDASSSQSSQKEQPHSSPQKPNDEDNDEPDLSNQSAPSQSGGSGGQNQQVPQEFLDRYDQFDDHSDWPKDLDECTRQDMQQMVDSLLAFAQEEVEKGHGTVPGEMVGILDRIKKKPRPVTDWKRHFRRYLGNEFTEFIRKSKKRESRRFPDAAGNRHRRKSNILVAIDTSGSVSMPEYREFFGQIKTLSASANFHVVECDTRIVHEYDFKGKIPETLHGGGGTDFEPVMDYFQEHRRLYDSLVYFTDGYSDIPSNTPKETLWVISSDGDKNRKRYLKNGASVVFIPKKN